MIAMISMNVISCLIISVACAFCVISPLVKDGIVGKVIYSCTSLAALSVVLGNLSGYTQPTGPAVTLHVCIAGIVIRHFTLGLIKRLKSNEGI